MTPLIPRSRSANAGPDYSNGSHGVTASSSPGAADDLTGLVQSMGLGRSENHMSETEISKVADALRRKLNLEGDTSIYSNLAKEFIRLQIAKSNEAAAAAAAAISPKPSSNLQASIGEEPTWSSDGSSPEHSEHSRNHHHERMTTTTMQDDDHTTSSYTSRHRHLSPAPSVSSLSSSKPRSYFTRTGSNGTLPLTAPSPVQIPKSTVDGSGRDRGRSPARAQSERTQSEVIRTKSRSLTPLGMGNFFGNVVTNGVHRQQSRDERTNTPDRRSASPLAAAIGKMFRRSPAADGSFPTIDTPMAIQHAHQQQQYSHHHHQHLERKTPPLDRRGIPRPNNTVTDPRELLKQSPPPPPPPPPQQQQTRVGSPVSGSPLRFRPIPLPTELAAANDAQRSQQSLPSIVEERMKPAFDDRQGIFNTRSTSEHRQNIINAAAGDVRQGIFVKSASASAHHNFPSVADAPSFDEDNTELQCPSSMSIDSKDTRASSSTTNTTNKPQANKPPFHSPDTRTPPLDRSINRGRSQGRFASKEVQPRSARSLSLQRNTPPLTSPPPTSNTKTKRRSPSPFGMKLFGRTPKASDMVEQMESVSEATSNGVSAGGLSPPRAVKNVHKPTDDEQNETSTDRNELPPSTPNKVARAESSSPAPPPPPPPPPPIVSPGLTPPRSHSLPPGVHIMRRPPLASDRSPVPPSNQVPPTPNTSPAMAEMLGIHSSQPQHQQLLQPALLTASLEEIRFNVGTSNRDLLHKKIVAERNKRSKSASACNRTASADTDEMMSIPPPFRAAPDTSSVRAMDMTPTHLDTMTTTGEDSLTREGSPMEIDEVIPSEAVPPPTSPPPIEFNVGVGERKPHPAGRRLDMGRAKMMRQRRAMPAPQREPVSDDQDDATSTNTVESEQQQQQQQQQAPHPSEHSVPNTEEPSTQPTASMTDHAVPAKESSSSANERMEDADNSGKRGLVNRLREQAKSSYLAKDFRSSVLNYTNAIKVHTTGGTSGRNDVLAVLLSNRAAGLVMIGAYGAAASDCEQALRYVSDSGTELSSDSGPVLRAKLYARMGKSLLKMGQTDQADAAFQNALRVAESTLRLSQEIRDPQTLDQHQNLFSQVMTEATLGKSEARRLRDTLDKLASCARMSSFRNAERRSSVEALSHVNMALATAYGSEDLHDKKVKFLVALKRWREVACHCERLAAELVKLDGVFTEDLAAWQPTPPLPPVRALNPSFFGDTREDEAAGASLKLSPKASADAVLRLPYSLMPHYIRSLRLEERYPCAESAISALEEYVKGHTGIQEQQMRVRFAWLSREKDKINRTKQGRERGDELFRSGDYKLACAQYASCLTIDGEGAVPDPDGENAGGRLHAVLHCNRAASLMAVKRFDDAVKDCTAALHIHARYMKAMLRRGRCYWRLERHDEAIEEYKKWLELVEEARALPSGTIFITPCLFDGPSEVSNDDLAQVKQELEEITKAKEKAETTAKAEESYRHERQRWYNDNFPQSGVGDAQSRREAWYNQKDGAYRRWDSFEGKSPLRSGRSHSANGTHTRDYQSNRSYSWRAPNDSSTKDEGSFRGPGKDEGASKSSTNKDEGTSKSKGSPGSDPSINHYAVLELTMTATDAEIKKAYRKVRDWLMCFVIPVICKDERLTADSFSSQLALKYHPDKNSEPEASEKFRRIKMAYEVLNDEFARRKYDAELRWNRRF